MPTIDTHGGPFTDAYQFAVTIPAQAKLYYTTDGSTPEVDRSLESKDGRFKGSETTIYRFMLAQEGYLNSPVATRSFIKQDTAYSLPVLCVNSDPDNFFDDTIGLYVKGTNGRVANNSKVKANQNMDWERPVNVEYLCPTRRMAMSKPSTRKPPSPSLVGGPGSTLALATSRTDRRLS